MKASEALRIGIGLRSSHHQDVRFCEVENRGLCSDAWGAICEAVQPAVAKFNWNSKDFIKVERAYDAFRAVQQHYFAAYWQMPARCPGSSQRFIEMGGRVLKEYNDQPVLKLDTEHAKTGKLAGVTSECDKVTTMAGMIDHLYHAHRWSREQVLEVLEWYEQTRSQGALLRSFDHYQVSGNRQLSTNRE